MSPLAIPKIHKQNNTNLIASFNRPNTDEVNIPGCSEESRVIERIYWIYYWKYNISVVEELESLSHQLMVILGFVGEAEGKLQATRFDMQSWKGTISKINQEILHF